MDFLNKFSKNPQISDFIKILPVGAEMFNDDGRTDRHNDAYTRISEFCDLAKKILRSAHTVGLCGSENKEYFLMKH